MSNSRCSLHCQISAWLSQIYFILQVSEEYSSATIYANNVADNIPSPLAHSELSFPILGPLAAASHFPSGVASIHPYVIDDMTY